MSLVHFGIVVLSILVDSLDAETVAVAVDFRIRHDLIARQVVVTDESLSWLFDIVCLGELSPGKELRERVVSIILSVHFEYLHGIVCQEVSNDEGPVLEFTVEAKDFPIVIEELFLGLYFASSELFLHVMKHLRIFFGENGNLRGHEVVNGAALGRRLRVAKSFIKLTSVLINVINPPLARENCNVSSNCEVLWRIRLSGTPLEALLLEKGSLRNT